MASVKQLFDLSGKIALITGGGTGLGLQIAQALGEQGATVFLFGRNKNNLQNAASLLAKQNIQVHTETFDLTNIEKIEDFVKQVLQVTKRIDILVNNAGTTWGAAAQDYPLTAWDKVMNLNIRSLFLLTQAVAKYSMIPNQQGQIINIASIAGLRGNLPGAMQTVAYNVSKAAVINLTKSLASEWGKFQINVNAIAPGIFRTKMTAAVIDHVGEARLTRFTPLQRLGNDDDIKGAILLFAADAGKFITGQILAIDGGASAV